MAWLQKKWDSARGETTRRNRAAKGRQMEQQLQDQHDSIYSKMPNYYSSVYDDPSKENYGQLKDQYSMDPALLSTDPNSEYMQYHNAIAPGERYDAGISGINRLQGIADTQGLTQFGRAQTDAQRLEQDNLYDDVSRGIQSQTAQGYENLASTQGLDSGAAERMFSRANQAGLQQMQEASRMGALQRGNIVAQDELAKRQIMQQMPGLNLQYDAYSTGQAARQADRFGARERANMSAQNMAQQQNINTSLQGAGNLYNTQYQQWKDKMAGEGNLQQSQQQIQNAYNAPSTWNSLSSMFNTGLESPNTAAFFTQNPTIAAPMSMAR